MSENDAAVIRDIVLYAAEHGLKINERNVDFAEDGTPIIGGTEATEWIDAMADG